MSFVEVVRRARDLLRQEGRVSLRALKLEFGLEEEQLEALAEELVDTQRVAEREGGVLSWVAAARSSDQSKVDAEPHPDVGGEAERRHLTVLFCDLVDSTRLAARMDAEDWREVVRRYQEAAAAVVERFGGHVAQFLGDGLLVYFGWPKAHEDDAERAVRAGLGIVDATRERASEAGTALSVRIGIHTGPVVVGEIGASDRRETLAIGDTTNLAARLQNIAEPDTVVMSAATLRLVSGIFVTRDRGEHALKGLAEPVRVRQAIQPSGVRSRLDVMAAAELTPFIGRDQELMLLEDRFAQVTEGNGQAVLIQGEAGIGKSRLVHTFRERIVERAHTWLECRGSAYTQDSAFYPVLELQRQWLAFPTDDSAETRLERIEAGLAAVGFDPAEMVPVVAALHGVALGERFTAPNRSPEGMRKKTLALLVEWLLRLGQRQALVLLLEDLHWMDPSTIELVGGILEQVPTASVLLLATYRPDFEPPWGARSYLTPMLLSRFTRAQLSDLVRKAARGRDLPDAWVEEILRRADGVPLFAEELTRTLLDPSTERAEDGALPLHIPETLQDSLMARLDQLGPVKEVAQLASCLGREFSFEVLLTVSPLVEAELAEGLRKAVDAEVFYQRGTPPEATYLFKHALIQEVAYESLLRSTRQRHHRRIAETLEKRFPEIVTTRPELVAHHYAEGGEAERAVEFFHRAGQRGVERSALTEAVRHLRRALGLLESLPRGPTRDGCELGLETLLGLGLAATEGYGSAAVERAFDRAAVLCRELGDSEALFPVLFGQWSFRMVRADAESELETAERLLALAESSGKDDLSVEAHLAMGMTLFWRGEYAEARRHLERVLALYHPERHAGHAFVYGQDPAAYAAAVLSHLLWITGWPDTGRRMEDLALAFAVADRVAHPFSVAGILGAFLIGNAAMRGELDRSLRQAERTRSICEEQGFPMFLGLCNFYEGYAFLGVGREREGLERLRDGLAATQATGSLVGRSSLLGRVAEACHRVGGASEGLAALDEAETFAEKHREHYWDAEISRLRGELLLLDAGRLPTPETCFREALEIARCQSARTFELRAAMSLARLWQRQGKAAEARDLLQPVYAWFTEGFDTRDLIEAKALLEELR